jgi:hypothetical protein
MADPEDILRLGIDAAREGNRDEARDLFDLLTRQQPNNIQGWLWLAGVAKTPDERRAALERVVALDPNNEMAVKGLQAMGVSSTPQPISPDIEPPLAATSVAVAAPPAIALSDDERYAAELDDAFTMADEIPRPTTPPRRELDAADAAAIGAATGAAAGATAARTYDADRPRSRPTPRSRTTAVRAVDDDDTVVVPARRGPSGLAWILLALVFLGLLGLLLWYLFFRDQPQPTTPDTAAPTAAVELPTLDPNAPIAPTLDPAAPTLDPAAPTLDPAAPVATVDPAAPAQPTADPNAPAQPTADPNAPLSPTPDPNVSAQPTAASPAPPATAANPLRIPNGAEISAANWNYTVPGQPTCAVSCAVFIGSNIGNFNATGRFVHVLVFVENNTGTGQAVPADFFVLRDAQGRVHPARPDVAAAAFRPGAADVSAQGPVPANGLTTSVYLVFDVPADATDLVLYSPLFPDQGWAITPQ